MVYTSKNQLPAKRGVSTTPPPSTFDLDSLNPLQLIEDLKRSLNKQSSTFIFLRKRENEKIQLQQGKVASLISLIETMTLGHKSLINYQAELFLSKQVFENIVNGFYLKAQQEAELSVKQHFDNLQKIDDEKESRRVVIDIEKAKLRQLIAAARLTELRGSLLDKVINEVNIGNINASQAFVLVKSLSPDANVDIDWFAKEAMVKEELNRMSAENDKLRAQARREKAQADMEEWDTREQMKVKK